MSRDTGNAPFSGLRGLPIARAMVEAMRDTDDYAYQRPAH
jgi:hypothetical protein